MTSASSQTSVYGYRSLGGTAAPLERPVSFAEDALRIGLRTVTYLETHESMIARVAQMPDRQKVAERLSFLDEASLEEDDCRLNRAALCSLVELLERADVPDPCLTVAGGLIWAQWEWDEFTSYLHLGEDGSVDYGRFSNADGEPLMHGRQARPDVAYDRSAPGGSASGS